MKGKSASISLPRKTPTVKPASPISGTPAVPGAPKRATSPAPIVPSPKFAKGGFVPFGFSKTPAKGKRNTTSSLPPPPEGKSNPFAKKAATPAKASKAKSKIPKFATSAAFAAAVPKGQRVDITKSGVVKKYKGGPIKKLASGGEIDKRIARGEIISDRQPPLVESNIGPSGTLRRVGTEKGRRTSMSSETMSDIGKSFEKERERNNLTPLGREAYYNHLTQSIQRHGDEAAGVATPGSRTSPSIYNEAPRLVAADKQRAADKAAADKQAADDEAATMKRKLSQTYAKGGKVKLAAGGPAAGGAASGYGRLAASAPVSTPVSKGPKVRKMAKGGSTGTQKFAEGGSVGLLERLRAGNIDDPSSEAYHRWGKGARTAQGDADYAALEAAAATPPSAAPAAAATPGTAEELNAVNQAMGPAIGGQPLMDQPPRPTPKPRPSGPARPKPAKAASAAAPAPAAAKTSAFAQDTAARKASLTGGPDTYSGPSTGDETTRLAKRYPAPTPARVPRPQPPRNVIPYGAVGTDMPLMPGMGPLDMPAGRPPAARPYVAQGTDFVPPALATPPVRPPPARPYVAQGTDTTMPPLPQPPARPPPARPYVAQGTDTTMPTLPQPPARPPRARPYVAQGTDTPMPPMPTLGSQPPPPAAPRGPQPPRNVPPFVSRGMRLSPQEILEQERMAALGLAPPQGGGGGDFGGGGASAGLAKGGPVKLAKGGIVPATKNPGPAKAAEKSKVPTFGVSKPVPPKPRSDNPVTVPFGSQHATDLGKPFSGKEFGGGGGDLVAQRGKGPVRKKFI